MPVASTGGSAAAVGGAGGEPQAREANAEERAAPLVQQRLDAPGAPERCRLGDLGGRVARAGERVRELGVRGRGARRAASRP